MSLDLFVLEGAIQKLGIFEKMPKLLRSLAKKGERIEKIII